MAALALAALAGAFVLWDVLVVTDEERLEALVDDATGTLSATGIERARARWVDPSRQPFELSALGESTLYDEEDEEALNERTRQAIATLSGSDVRRVSSSIEVDGDQAIVTLRALSDLQGMVSVEWTLHRHGNDWLVARMWISR